jgi:hypothetical protein
MHERESILLQRVFILFGVRCGTTEKGRSAVVVVVGNSGYKMGEMMLRSKYSGFMTILCVMSRKYP